MSRPDAAPSLLRLAVARHWLGIATFAVVVGIPATAVLATQPEQSYRQTRAYLVGVPEPVDGRVVTTNTDRAARDYGTVLRKDSVLLSKLAAAIATTVGHVRDHLDAGYVTGSSALYVRYESADRAEGEAVFAELDRLVRTEGIPTSSFAKGVVRPLGPGQVEVRRSYARLVPGEGLLVAVLLAVAAAVLVERSRPQVRGRAQLQAQTSHAVLHVRDEDDLDLLAVRVLRATPRRVVVVGAGDDVDPARFVARLIAAAESLAATGRRRGGLPSIDVATADETPQAGDTWLVVAPVGTSLPTVEDMLVRLDEADVVVVLDATSRLVPA